MIEECEQSIYKNSPMMGRSAHRSYTQSGILQPDCYYRSDFFRSQIETDTRTGIRLTHEYVTVSVWLGIIHDVFLSFVLYALIGNRLRQGDAGSERGDKIPHHKLWALPQVFTKASTLFAPKEWYYLWFLLGCRLAFSSYWPGGLQWHGPLGFYSILQGT